MNDEMSLARGSLKRVHDMILPALSSQEVDALCNESVSDPLSLQLVSLDGRKMPHCVSTDPSYISEPFSEGTTRNFGTYVDDSYILGFV